MNTETILQALPVREDIKAISDDIEKLKSAWAPTLQDLQQQFPNIHPNSRDMASGYLHAFRLAAKRQLEEQQEMQATERRMQRMAISGIDFKKEVLERCLVRSHQENFTFVLDDDNKQVFDLLLLYFTNNPEFENYGIGDRKYSLKKGIWLQSAERGSGKSFLLRAFNLNPIGSFYSTHTERLRTLYQSRGIDEIEKSITLNQGPCNALDFYSPKYGMMFDEMFNERIGNYMGNQLFISEYIINSLYDFVKGKDWFYRFHITSNYDGEMIENKYGATIRSRMKEMFNLIKLPGKDRR